MSPAAVAAGDYKLSATLGTVASNHWSVRLSRPRYKEAFSYFDVGWDNTSNIDSGRPYVNIPQDIAQANEKRAALHRNAAIQSLSDNVNFQDFSGGGAGAGLAAYQGRDSSSEIAEAEMILRQSLSLPAHAKSQMSSRGAAKIAKITWFASHLRGFACDPFA